MRFWGMTLISRPPHNLVDGIELFAETHANQKVQTFELGARSH